MISTNIIAIIVFGMVICISYIFIKCYENFRRKATLIDQIPGPKGYPFIGNVSEVASLASSGNKS